VAENETVSENEPPLPSTPEKEQGTNQTPGDLTDQMEVISQLNQLRL
jgi:hypothetical protein